MVVALSHTAGKFTFKKRDDFGRAGRFCPLLYLGTFVGNWRLRDDPKSGRSCPAKIVYGSTKVGGVAQKVELAEIVWFTS